MNIFYKVVGIEENISDVVDEFPAPALGKDALLIIVKLHETEDPSLFTFRWESKWDQIESENYLLPDGEAG